MPAMVEGHYGCPSAEGSHDAPEDNFCRSHHPSDICRVLGEIRGQFRDLEQFPFQLR